MFSVIQASVDCVPNLLVMTDLWSIYSILLGPVGRFLPHAIQYILEKMYAVLFCVVLLSFVWSLQRYHPHPTPPQPTPNLPPDIFWHLISYYISVINDLYVVMCQWRQLLCASFGSSFTCQPVAKNHHRAVSLISPRMPGLQIQGSCA